MKSFFHRSPDYNFFGFFCCTSFPNLSTQVSYKHAHRSISYAFLCYASEYKGYRCLDPKCGCVYVSRHVTFHELVFLYPELSISPIVSPHLSPLTLYLILHHYIMHLQPHNMHLVCLPVYHIYLMILIYLILPPQELWIFRVIRSLTLPLF